MSDTPNYHFIPQFYLWNFSASCDRKKAEVFIFDQSIPKNVRDTGRERRISQKFLPDTAHSGTAIESRPTEPPNGAFVAYIPSGAAVDHGAIFGSDYPSLSGLLFSDSNFFSRIWARPAPCRYRPTSSIGLS